MPSQANLVTSSIDTTWTDAVAPISYYKLTAVDVNGNESAPAAAMPSGTAGVSDAVAAFALERLPNPVVGGQFTVAFSLPVAGHATLDVVDLSGRQVARRDVGLLGAGRHTVAMDEGRPLAAGVYFVRLTQGARQATARVTVLK